MIILINKKDKLTKRVYKIKYQCPTGIQVSRRSDYWHQMDSTLKFKNLQERKNEKNDISEFHDLQPKFSNSSFHEIHNQFLFHVLFPELTDFQNGGNPAGCTQQRSLGSCSQNGSWPRFHLRQSGSKFSVSTFREFSLFQGKIEEKNKVLGTRFSNLGIQRFLGENEEILEIRNFFREFSNKQ